MEDPALSLATTTQIFEEMKRRYPIAFVMTGLKDRDGDKPEDDMDSEVYLAYRNVVESIGLASLAISLMKKEKVKRMQFVELEPDGDEEE